MTCPLWTQYSEVKEQIIGENIPSWGLTVCQVNHCTVERVSEIQRVNAWAYISMAPFHGAVGAVGSLRGSDYLTRSREEGQPVPLEAEEYACGVRMGQSPAGCPQQKKTQNKTQIVCREEKHRTVPC